MDAEQDIEPAWREYERFMQACNSLPRPVLTPEANTQVDSRIKALLAELGRCSTETGVDENKWAAAYRTAIRGLDQLQLRELTIRLRELDQESGAQPAPSNG
ncbi:MAG: hypothetical protein IT431_11655 [Phycisphaerales bacterium]|nr:hypothetical protein [Phycisphaerales bacterium]